MSNTAQQENINGDVHSVMSASTGHSALGTVTYMPIDQNASANSGPCPDGDISAQLHVQASTQIDGDFSLYGLEYMPMHYN